MLEKPSMSEDRIRASLRDAYGVRGDEIAFLPVGADQNTAAYRVVDRAGAAFFVKLRLAGFDPMSVLLPAFLRDRGIAHIMAPLANATGQLWTTFDGIALIVYPFVAGDDGYTVALSDAQWIALGATLRRLHTTTLPPDLAARIRLETYPAEWHARVGSVLAQLEGFDYHDAVTARLAAFVRAHRGTILDLVDRAERLAAALQAQPRSFVFCHSDLHAGNVLIGDDGAFFVVDWDDPILAPKERDLMYVGGAQGFVGRSAQQEATLFYRGYGPTGVDRVALAYYRYERILIDIALFWEQILSTEGDGPDRAQGLRYLMANFAPGGTIEAARAGS